MKRKTFVLLLIGIFVGLMALIYSVDDKHSLFSSVMAFPFEQIGMGLRTLSLSGKIGNGLAVSICVAIALLPLILVFKNGSKKSYLAENVILCCMSIVTYLIIYGMANPSRVYSGLLAEESFDSFKKGNMGCIMWSLIVLWGIIRVLRLFGNGNTKKLLSYLRITLYALCVVFVAANAISCGSELYKGLSVKQESMDSVIAVIRFITSSVPYVCDIVITLSLLTLLELYVGKQEDDMVRYVELLSKRCCMALGVSAASTVFLNVFQFLFSRYISNVSVYVDIPIFSFAFVLLTLILLRLIVENHKLQSDNELFI
jgi:hypothetical protein